MAGLYRIMTSHGSLLAEDARTGEIASFFEADLGPDNPVLHMFVSEHRPECGFMLAAHSGPLRVGTSLTGSGVLPLGLGRDGHGTVSFYAPDDGIWMVAAPPDASPPRRGRVMIGRRAIKSYERFTLLPPVLDDVPVAVQRKAARLADMLARPLDLDALRAADVQDGPLLEAVSRLAFRHHVERFAADLAASADDCARLAGLFPADLAAERGLPALAEWLGLRRTDGPSCSPVAPPPSREITLGLEFDPIAIRNRSSYVSLPYLCNSLARRSVIPGRDLCIIATARNEGVGLLEWLAYHRAIGVQDVFLYSNDDEDGSDVLLSCLAEAGTIRWARNVVTPGVSPQYKAYGHALSLQPEVLEYAWALIIDLDEYLVFNPSLFGFRPRLPALA